MVKKLDKQTFTSSSLTEYPIHTVFVTSKEKAL